RRSLLLCLLMIRLPPLSPLFPYTTLFRSLRFDVCPPKFLSLARLDASRLISTVHTLSLFSFTSFSMCSGCSLIHSFLLFDIFCRDRKSTRLNSSHVKISYAVFCLKKKTIC